jgi:tetratricopeptide (TPR) repeat protein
MNKQMKLYIYLIITIALSFSCKKETAVERESEEMQQADMQFAYKLLENNKKMEAAEIFQKVLYNNPDNSRAHLELAIIYHQTNDFINAMYHYRQYGKLQPDSQKFELAAEQLRLAVKEFTWVQNQRAERRTPQEEPEPEQNSNTNIIEVLKNQNLTLTDEIKSLKTKITSLEKTVQSQAQVLRNRQEKISEYKVLEGDHLEGIALKIYGDENQWRILYDTNKDRLNLKTPNNIKVGQTLIIPWDNNK